MMVTWVIGATAFVGLVLATGKLFSSVFLAWRRIDTFLDDWNGAPARPGFESIPSMPERVSRLEHRLEAVEAKIGETP